MHKVFFPSPFDIYFTVFFFWPFIVWAIFALFTISTSHAHAYTHYISSAWMLVNHCPMFEFNKLIWWDWGNTHLALLSCVCIKMQNIYCLPVPLNQSPFGLHNIRFFGFLYGFFFVISPVHQFHWISIDNWLWTATRFVHDDT